MSFQSCQKFNWCKPTTYHKSFLQSILWEDLDPLVYIFYSRVKIMIDEKYRKRKKKRWDMFYFFLFVFQILNLAPNIKKELAKNESSKGVITFNIPISYNQKDSQTKCKNEMKSDTISQILCVPCICITCFLCKFFQK